MQDVRLRIVTATILSLAAFSGITGAAGAMAWWLLFSRPREVLARARALYPAIILIGIFSIFLELTGGGGLSYGFRMGVIILIGAWVYAEYRPGDFLGFFTWILGRKTGFDAGMIAEMGIQSLDLMVADLSRVRMANRVKRVRWGIRALVPAVNVLFRGALRRAEDTAEILAMKGYRAGGSYCPVFPTGIRDLAGTGAAICMGIIALLPARAFFIL